MGNTADRPIPRSGTIDPEAAREILWELLGIERVRLAQAVAMEKERKIVFPETTVIIRDIEHLVSALHKKASGPESSIESFLEELANG